ncbi:atrial natriuretic peptide-converting enzyme, partial [Biomphalaria glabrata]
GTCISGRYRCDGMVSCDDHSDEARCVNCSSYAWQCKNGDCITLPYRCDGFSHCTDSSDERNCSVCSVYSWRCANGQCIREGYRCDGLSDCDDSSDETNCTVSTDNKCRCKKGKCTDINYKCDGVNDCKDRRDEGNCVKCSRNAWPCASGKCISEGKRCDCLIDCNDGSDEMNCTHCSPSAWTCDNGKCILMMYRCNGLDTCGDSSDELNCDMCFHGAWRCGNGKCILNKYRCDGHNFCGDNSDEWNCDQPTVEITTTSSTSLQANETHLVTTSFLFETVAPVRNADFYLYIVGAVVCVLILILVTVVAVHLKFQKRAQIQIHSGQASTSADYINVYNNDYSLDHEELSRRQYQEPQEDIEQVYFEIENDSSTNNYIEPLASDVNRQCDDQNTEVKGYIQISDHDYAAKKVDSNKIGKNGTLKAKGDNQQLAESYSSIQKCPDDPSSLTLLKVTENASGSTYDLLERNVENHIYVVTCPGDKQEETLVKNV